MNQTRKEKDELFIKSLNKEIDRKIDIIEAGKMEPVIRMKKFDYVLSAIIIMASLILLVVQYCMI